MPNAEFDDRIRKIAGTKHRTRKNEDGIYEIPLRGDGIAVYQHSNWCGDDTLLAAHIASARPNLTFSTVKTKCPNAVISQLGGDGGIITCPLRDWKVFAKAVGAKTTRRLSCAHRQKLTTSGQPFRFMHGSEKPQTSLKSPIAETGGPRHVRNGFRARTATPHPQDDHRMEKAK